MRAVKTSLLSRLFWLAACFCFATSQDKSNDSSLPASLSAGRDIQFVYTDELIKVMEKYGITDEELSMVMKNYGEGKPPVVMRTQLNETTGEEKIMEINLKHFVNGGHLTDLSKINEKSTVSPLDIDQVIPPTAVPPPEENTAHLNTEPKIQPDPIIPGIKIVKQSELDKQRAEEDERLKVLRGIEQDILGKIDANRAHFEELMSRLQKVRQAIYEIELSRTTEENRRLIAELEQIRKKELEIARAINQNRRRQFIGFRRLFIRRPFIPVFRRFRFIPRRMIFRPRRRLLMPSVVRFVNIPAQRVSPPHSEQPIVPVLPRAEPEMSPEAPVVETPVVNVDTAADHERSIPIDQNSPEETPSPIDPTTAHALSKPANTPIIP